VEVLAEFVELPEVRSALTVKMVLLLITLVMVEAEEPEELQNTEQLLLF
jgi:hypothetical protein